MVHLGGGRERRGSDTGVGGRRGTGGGGGGGQRQADRQIDGQRQ